MHADFDVVRKIPSSLRENDYSMRAIVFKEHNLWYLLDIRPASSSQPIYGLAVDLGTSTVVVRLLDLVSGETKEEISFPNPQIKIGPDILTRIHYASQAGRGGRTTETNDQTV